MRWCRCSRPSTGPEGRLSLCLDFIRREGEEERSTADMSKRPQTWVSGSECSRKWRTLFTVCYSLIKINTAIAAVSESLIPPPLHLYRPQIGGKESEWSNPKWSAGEDSGSLIMGPPTPLPHHVFREQRTACKTPCSERSCWEEPICKQERD